VPREAEGEGRVRKLTFASSPSDKLTQILEFGSSRATFERDDLFGDLVLVNPRGIAQRSEDWFKTSSINAFRNGQSS
jgi:hypothetical protein